MYPGQFPADAAFAQFLDANHRGLRQHSGASLLAAHPGSRHRSQFVPFPYFTENLNAVVLLNVWPGRTIGEGKCVWFTESG